MNKLNEVKPENKSSGHQRPNLSVKDFATPSQTRTISLRNVPRFQVAIDQLAPAAAISVPEQGVLTFLVKN